jgi:hypothetical protein
MPGSGVCCRRWKHRVERSLSRRLRACEAGSPAGLRTTKSHRWRRTRPVEFDQDKYRGPRGAERLAHSARRHRSHAANAVHLGWSTRRLRYYRLDRGF